MALKLLFFVVSLNDFFTNLNLSECNYYYFFKEHFYNCSTNESLFIELLPEITLILFLFYNLINIFNDKKIPIFQYYK